MGIGSSRNVYKTEWHEMEKRTNLSFSLRRPIIYVLFDQGREATHFLIGLSSVFEKKRVIFEK